MATRKPSKRQVAIAFSRAAKKSRDNVLGVRFTEEERARVDAAAAFDKRSTSDWVRLLALSATETFESVGKLRKETRS